MDILFNAKEFDGQDRGYQKEIYTQVIFSIYNRLKEKLDLSLLDLIIIPEDYKEGLFDFQRQNEHNVFITENEYGRGMAQVVSSKNKMGETVYNIVIDKDLIFVLVGESQLESIKNNLNSEEEYRLFLSARQLAINTLYHEFVHIHEYSLNSGIDWIQNKDVKTDLRSQYIFLAIQCWSEYFACRISSESFPLDESVIRDVIATCINVENVLQKQRSEYNKRKIGLDEFVTKFHAYTDFLLKKIASTYGNLYCVGNSREKIIDFIEEGLGESYTKVIWKDYDKILDKLYQDYPDWKDDDVFDDVCDVIVKYYNQYEIYISETAQGMYYDIPVRL